MEMPDQLICLLRNLYAGQESTVRTGHEMTDWFQIRKGICQGYILSPCLFSLYEAYTMWNAGQDEAQAGIKIARRNINNLRYADDTTLIAESEELKSLLMKVKEESLKAGLWRTVWRFLKKLQIELPMAQQSHCWAYTPRKPELKEACVPQCSSQHCL